MAPMILMMKLLCNATTVGPVMIITVMKCKYTHCSSHCVECLRSLVGIRTEVEPDALSLC
jgi:hypothetical protein